MSEKTSSTAKAQSAKSEAPAAARRGSASAPASRSPREEVVSLHRTVGNQAVQRLLETGRIKAKLKLGAVGDEYEQEADRVAEQVMRTPDPVVRMKPG